MKYGDYLGLVYFDSSNKIKEIGVLAKVVGFYGQIALSNQSNKSVNVYSVSLEVLGRMKILEHEHVNKLFSDTDLFSANIELLEDEISKSN